MKDIKPVVFELAKRLKTLKESINLPGKNKKIEILELELADPNLWNDQQKARKVTQELFDLKKELEKLENMGKAISALEELLEEGGIIDDLEKDVLGIEKDLSEMEFSLFLSGEHDGKNAMLSIHAGQGGTEAMDWTSMLLRMYLKFCEKRGWKTEMLDCTNGEEAGIKSVTVKVAGSCAYGYLKGEAGTHRLVRQSPFNADKLRQTSFALVEVLPELQAMDLPDIEIKDEDLDWQFFRSSSQGGQNVQKVSTAVRLIHKPTGIMVTAQNERFQERNRENALGLLRAKLWLLQKTKENNVKKGIKGDYRPASWGTQIRSYVLHPYKMVKDLRTEIETGNAEAVLAGGLDEFIEAELRLGESAK